MSTFFTDAPLFPPAIYEKIERTANLLQAHNHILVTAESCTGGLIAALCTEISGSSGWFYGSTVSYDNSVKTGSLGVRPATLDLFGAVSKETVVEMATGALNTLGGTVSIAVSGIAGPSGGLPGKPVGTVWIAAGIRLPNAIQVCPAHFFFSGSRHQIRLQAVAAALDAACQIILEHDEQVRRP